MIRHAERPDGRRKEAGRTFDRPGKRGGDKRTVIMREVVNGLMYILSTVCQWRAIPKDLPPKSTIYDYFELKTCETPVRPPPSSIAKA